MMIDNPFNVLANQKKQIDEATKALTKAKAQEKKRLKQGWKWIRISNLSKVLVPCDKNGKPTKEGQRRIDVLRNKVNIIL